MTQELQVHSSCKECVFAEKAVDIQTGCALNRPEKLGLKKAT